MKITIDFILILWYDIYVRRESVLMKKQRKLKKWVKYTLVFIFLSSMLIGTSECEDMKLFVITHIIAGITLLLSGTILIKNMDK